jgi:hypothetical protein
MNYTLRIDGEALDMLSGNNIPVTLQAFSINEPDARLGSFSRSFDLPMTDHNKRILGNSNFFNTTSKNAYRKINAVVEIDGLPLSSGYIEIQDVGMSEKVVTVNYYTGNSSFFSVCKNIKMNECDFGSCSHLRSDETIINSFITTRDYIYPIIDYTGDTAYMDATDREIQMSRMLPAIKSSKYKAAIEAKTGYTLNGEIFSSQLWTNLIFPFSLSKLVRKKEDAAERINTDLEYLPAQTMVATPLYPNPLWNTTVIKLADVDGNGDAIGVKGTRDSFVPYVTNNAEPTHGHFSFPDYALCSLEVTMQIVLSTVTTAYIHFPSEVYPQGTYANQGYPVGDWSLPIVKCVNTSNGLTYFGHLFHASALPNDYETGWCPLNSPSGILNFPASLPAGTYDVTVTTQFYSGVRRSCGLRMWCNNNVTVSNVRTKIRYIEDLPFAQIPFLPNNSGLQEISEEDYYEVKYGYEVWDSQSLVIPEFRGAHCWITGSDLVPSMTIAEFIKSIANLFGCIIIVDDDKRSVNFYGWDEVYRNISGAKDISEYLVNTDNAKWSSRPAKAFQRNSFGYNNSDDISESGGRYFFDIDNTTLGESGVMIQLPYSYTPTSTRWTDKEVPQIIRFDDSGKVTGEDKQHILLLNLAVIDTANVTFYNRTGGVHIRSTFIYYCYFNDSSKAIQLGFDTHVFENRYRWYRYIFDNYKMLSAEMILSPQLVNELELWKPVYISYYAANFLITKISDWVYGEPCKVELLKLN